MSVDMEILLDSVRHVESRGNTMAVSPKGAQGPYQFMPDTAAEYGVDNPFDEAQARSGAKRYLTKLIDTFDGNVEYAIAAYNGGPNRLKRHGSIEAMPEETRNYLSQVMEQYSKRVLSGVPVDAESAQPTATLDDILAPGVKGQRRLMADSITRQEDRLRASVLDPKPVDQASRIYSMQLRTGLPADLIERNLDEIEQRAKQEDFDPESFRRESPLLAEWLTKNPTRASLAQGDYENLSALEKSWATLQAIPFGINQNLKQERELILGYKAASGEITPQEEIERKQLKIEIQGLSSQFEEGAPEWTKAAAGFIAFNIPMGIEAAKQGVLQGLPAGAAGGAAVGATLGFLGGPGAPATVPAGALAGAAAGGVLGAKMTTGAAYIDQLYKVSVGDVYGNLEEATDANGNHIDPIAARYAAFLVAVPTAILETASLRTSLKAIPFVDKVIGKYAVNEMKQILVRPTVMAAMKNFSKKYAAAVGTETFTEGMQEFISIITEETLTGGDIVTEENTQRVGSVMEKTAKGASVLGALASGPKVIELYADMEKAAQNEQFMRNLGDMTANSKTFQNSPEAFGEYVKHLKESSPVKNVFIPIEQWDTLFQSEAPNAAKEVFGNLNQYSEAEATGGDLVVPIETYAEKLAGTEFHEKLIPHMRLNPGEMTPTEAMEAEKAEPEILAGLKMELADMQAKEAPLAAVFQDIYSKLRQIGMGQREAERNAIIWREHLRGMSDLTGFSPMQLYSEKPLIVQREFPTDIADQLVKYNQQLAEPAIPFAHKLPLEGGEINLPPATQQEKTASAEAISAATQSQRDYGVFGATVHPSKGNLSGTEGVAVAGYPQRGVVTEGAPTQAELETFMRRNRDIFQADPNAALGIWLDNESGKGYVDITNALPRDLAIAQGERLGEKAVWDLGAFEEIRLPTQGKSTQGMLFQGERGVSVPMKNLIALLKGADVSTFIHESGHLWFEELRNYALRPDASEKVKKYWETAKEWTGATDENISKEAHEKFARGFEVFMMEGKAPSFQLRQVFAELKDWMKRIYQSLAMLDVELTPEVRDMFDHLIATDEAIKQTRERNAYDIPLLDRSMMTEAEYAAYNEVAMKAKAISEDNFRAKVMKELKREKLQAWRDEKKALEPVVRAEILDIPVYKAAYWLWSGALPDGTKIEGMAATKLDKQALLDLGVTLTDLPFRYQENGLHPDVVAELFGFSSGESLVRELIGLPTLKKAIDEEVSRRIREEHGGIIVQGTTMEEAAMEVQNTQQIDVFNMELRILKRLGARKEITHPAVMKDIARQIVSRKKLKDLDPRVFEEAALRASQEAQEAMLGYEFRMGTGRNLDKAFDAKQKEMLNVFIFREAMEKKLETDKTLRKWNKFLFRSDERLAKTHDMNMVNAARAIASVHGIGGSADTAAGYMRALEQYDPDSYNSMREVVDLASSDGRPMEDLTVADFSIVRDAIEGLWTLARRSRQVDIEGKKIERTQIVGELNTRIGELVKPDKKRAGYDRAISNWDKTKMGFLGAFAMLRRVEFWVDAMDNGDPNGVFRKYIWQPISEAADRYRDARRTTLEKYQELVKSIPKETFKVGKIDAPEIGYEFANKTELLGALLHTGNDSNLQKLLRGREWGTFTKEGELDSTKWDHFITRMQAEGVLTEADYKFVQSVWDLLDELKPAAQKAHKEMYGYFFDEVTARPIQTPFGTFAGGYYPALVDPFIVEDANIRAEKETLEGRPSSFMFPTTGRGFTKKRTELYAKPLSLDLGLIPNHMEKVLRFIHLEPRVKDIGRVAIDKEFRSHLAHLDSEIGTSMLMPWLQRSALQLVEQPSGPRMRQLDSFFHAVRANTGLQIMAVNASVALQQVSGIALSALKVKPRYLAGALWRYTSSPRNYTAHVNESSVFMRNRLTSQIMEIRQSIDNIVLNPSKYQKAKAFANEHGYFMQTGMQNAVDMITWGGAYEQATRNGADEKSAIRQADSAVRETQGTFHAEDISRFEAGPAHLRLFAMFYSYFNMAANLNATEFTKAMRRNGFEAGGRAFYIYMMGFAIPAVIGEAIVQAMSGSLFDDDDDDGYLDNILSVFFNGQARMGTAMVPLIGSVAQVGINMFNNKWYDDHIGVSPAISTLEATARVPYDIYKLASEEDARLKRPMQDILTAVGMVTGLPAAPIAKPLGYLSDIEQGYIEDPNNPVEFTRGLMSGKAPK